MDMLHATLASYILLFIMIWEGETNKFDPMAQKLLIFFFNFQKWYIY